MPMRNHNQDKNTSIKLSVIVPVYNVEPYLSMCLSSLLSMQTNEIEYICVAGKSDDDSMRILREYAIKDNRITILEQQDTGLGEARNLGIGYAAGEYIMFADGDDFVKPHLFQKLFLAIKDHPTEDVFVTDFCMISTQVGVIRENPIYQIGPENDGVEGLDFLPKMLKKRQCFWNVWRYVYRRSFLESHEISFLSHFMGEDVDFTNRVLMSNPKILFLHCPFYCYRVDRETSMMSQTTSKRICDTISLLANNIKSLANSDFKWSQNLIEQYQFEFILTTAQIYEVPKEERKTVKNVIKKALPAMNVGDDRIAKTMYYVFSLLGIKTVASCLAVAKKIKHRITYNNRKKWATIEESIC